VWELIVQLPRDPVSGKYKQMSRVVRGTKREAQRQLSALVASVSEGKVTSAAVSLDELIARWLEARGERLSPTTAREYARLAKTIISPALGSQSIGKIKAHQLDALYAGLVNERGLSPSSVRQVHAVIRSSLNQAVKWGWLSENPAVKASPPAVRRSEIVPPELQTAMRLLATAEKRDPEFAILLRVLAATGARRGEVCALQWTDVDLDKRTLVIKHSIAKVADGVVQKDTKTHASRRIALDDATVRILRHYRTEIERRAKTIRVKVRDDAYVFSPDPDGGLPLHPDLVSGRFRSLCRKLGITGVRLHDLRHLHATQLLAAGVPVRTVSGRLGHANASTTLNVYAHFLEASDREAADVVSRLFDATS
jgi:integrase